LNLLFFDKMIYLSAKNKTSTQERIGV